MPCFWCSVLFAVVLLCFWFSLWFWVLFGFVWFGFFFLCNVQNVLSVVGNVLFVQLLFSGACVPILGGTALWLDIFGFVTFQFVGHKQVIKTHAVCNMCCLTHTAHPLSKFCSVRREADQTNCH